MPSLSRPKEAKRKARFTVEILEVSRDCYVVAFINHSMEKYPPLPTNFRTGRHLFRYGTKLSLQFHSTSFFIKGKLCKKKCKSAQMIQIRFTHVPSNLNKRSDLSLLKQIYNDRFFWRWPKLPWKKFNSPLFQYKQRLLVGIPCNPAHLSRVQNANSTGPRRTQN